MSTTEHYFSGHGNGKSPADKSNFAQTCDRLSMFLKAKRNLRDLNSVINGRSDAIGGPETSLAITPTKTATADLLRNMQNHAQNAAEKEKSTDLLPQYASLDSFCKPEDSTNKASSGKTVGATESGTAQMTVFYGGKVLVFDDIPADRARDLMLGASSCPSNGKIENRVQLASTPDSPVEASRSQEKDSDLPIARRASLHKFLAKRKGRAAVKAPYQLQNQSPEAGTSGKDRDFDLNF